MIDITLSINLIKNERTIRTIFLALGIILFIYILLSIRLADIMNAFNILGLNILILCMILITELVIKSIRFKFLLKRIADVSFLNVFKIIFQTTLFVVYSPGKSGELMKLDLFKKYGIRRTDTFAAIVVERVADLVMVTLFSLGLLFSFNLSPYPVILIIVIGITSLVILYKLKIFKGVIDRVFESIKKFGDGKIVFVLCIFTPLLWLTDALIPYFTLKLLGYNVAFQTVASLYFASILIGLMSMIPGGLGALDFSFSYALSNLAGVLKSDAIITIMISRIVAFIVCFAGTILYFKEFRGAYHGRESIAKSEKTIK